MPTSGNACARKGRSETWQFAKNKFWSDFVRKQTFRESRQALLRKRMSRGFEFVLILQTTRGSNFGLLVYLPFDLRILPFDWRSLARIGSCAIKSQRTNQPTAGTADLTRPVLASHLAQDL
ncbi:hypothetical protein AVEN_96183-1 [Araneus ventricosus]|uniref:Uncharacterized protein n=1 Tax=Araneus ventricosus TaxID=182803 RepID=A0A4Y2FT19_ARAVE|nr:hypothetical protein AVEN_96183-1 [Araneus ventricosus]